MAHQSTARDALDAALDAACPTDEGQRLLDAYRAEVLTEASAMLRAHCPQHANGETAFMSCHCPAATELDRAARTAPDAP